MMISLKIITLLYLLHNIYHIFIYLKNLLHNIYLYIYIFITYIILFKK